MFFGLQSVKKNSVLLLTEYFGTFYFDEQPFSSLVVALATFICFIKEQLFLNIEHDSTVTRKRRSTNGYSHS